ncbi:MAG: PKD domain-containing protein [Alphaproteobacteria bacterium]|nr:PKD domain-containing protein [Alphaproteobacteria bacterium]
MIWALALACTRGADDTGPTDDSAPLAQAVADAGEDLTGLVGEPLTFDGSASAGVSFTWDFGDGATAQGARVEHTYAEPGNFTAVLQVTGEDGGRRSDRARAIVHLPLTETPPRWSGPLALDPTRGLAWVVVPEADTLARVDLSSREVAFIGISGEPVATAVDGEQVAVVTRSAPALTLLDAQGDVVDQVALPDRSQPAAVVGRDGAWWVTLQATGALARWNGDALTVEPNATDPRGLALDAEGRAWVTRWRSPDSGGEITRSDGQTWTLAVDTRPDSDTTTGGVPNLIEQVVPAPDGQRFWVPATQHNLRRGSYLSGEALSHETAMVAVLVTLDPSGAELARKQFDDRGRSIAAVPSPEGGLLYVLHPGTGTVSVLDTWTGNQAGSIADVGVGANGLVLSADGDTLYVHAWLDRELRAFDVSDLSVPPPLLWAVPTVAQEPLDPELLQGKRLFYSSADPRITRDGYIACAHCHPDGRDDGRVWDFTDRGEGLRNTTSLEGRAGTGMGPVHWTGNFDEIQDFENDIRNHFAGTGLLDDADWAEASDPLGPAKAGRSDDLDALAAFVTALDATPPSPFEAPEGGAAAFNAAGCPACHPAPLYTDSSLDSFLRHDVGTLGPGSGQRLGGPLDGLDTPTLLGSWDTAPYLHDGSAPALEDAIEAHDIELSEEEVAAIAGFVRSL